MRRLRRSPRARLSWPARSPRWRLLDPTGLFGSAGWNVLVITMPTDTDTAGKAIVLFSDGTGNSSAKLFKTNVWRMYEAVDLGPPAEGKRPQISYYDDGVGTSGFKPLAALGGAFGWGLKRNVLDIYRYACRNYRDGDDIYVFGFSRGAFTARLVAALIAAEGLVRSDDEADLQRKSVAAYRAFRTKFLPRRLQWPTHAGRAVRNAVVEWFHRRLHRKPYEPAQNWRPKIRFVGVWDTVSAYGGPITEITRAIDNWFFPLSMPDYHLPEQVCCARHALAIDDERDAFHPLLWDEVHEEELARDETRNLPPDRLRQVWFTGMHADVGGGYPDESLSYVSLLWMMEEAERQDLRTLKTIKDRFVALASSFGPLHNSRAGLGAYYRYQPRRIAAWLNPVDQATLSLRDSAIKGADGKSRGLLQSVRVHESVINRIASGTDRYAPITLPKHFEVFPPQAEGENVPQADSETPAAASTVVATEDGPRLPMLKRETVEKVEDASLAAARDACSESIWNRVWWRRITYFTTVFFTLLLLGLPLLLERLPTPPWLADGRTWIGGVIRLLTVVLPGFAANWIEVYADNPFYFLLFTAIILALLSFGRWMERALRDEARHVWQQTLDGTPATPRHSWVKALRTSPAYQRFIFGLKWYVLPDWIITPVSAAALAWILFAAFVQARLPDLEDDFLCRPSAVPPAAITRISRDFSPKDVCSASFGTVIAGQRYVVTFDVLDAWHDASLPTSPQGLPSAEFPLGFGYLAGPLKRVINAHYLQPLIEIRPTDGKDGWLSNLQIYPLAVEQVGDTGTLFRAEFKAARDGELFLFVNDAMLPFKRAPWGKLDYKYFYEASGSDTARGNRGSACVTVESADAQRSADAQTPSGSVCTQLAARN
jgi:uncharacterized protein (DUF2235 family)